MESQNETLEEIGHRLCMPVDTDIKLESVILSEENRKKIEAFLVETENKERFTRYKLKPVNKVLMSGASGTGKTYLTKALSNYLGYEMFYVDISTALDAGIATKSLNEIFEVANAKGKAVIFLDECDAICWARDDVNNNDDASIRRANNALFQLLDQMNSECVFVSATNLYKNLDPAFVRRFNEHLVFEPPNITNLDETIQKFKNSVFVLQKDVDIKVKKLLWQQAEVYGRLSYYQIQGWVERVEKEALIRKEILIKESTIYRYLMEALRIEIGEGKDGLYLHQYGAGRKTE